MAAVDKLYPPKIDNILRAFHKADSETKVNILIPFWLNPAVGEDDFKKIKYIIKSATSNREILNGSSTWGYNDQEKQYEILLSLDKSKFSIGQYYKIQIAFIDQEDKVGYYSSAGVAKCVAEPSISIQQSDLREITGIFSDTSTREKVYTYSFKLYDEFNTLLEDSGELVHNVNNDTDPEENVDHWEIITDLKPDIKYYVKYSAITTNNYHAESDRVEIQYFETIEPNLEDCYFLVDNNFEEGYNRVYLKRLKSANNRNIAVYGNFVLLRASFKDNYKTWEKLFDFQLYNWKYKNNSDNIYEIYKDYLIEQGVSYKYAIQAYSKHKPTGESKNVIIYSTKLLNTNGVVYSDFEDIFLYDGERQLKIRFNPKVSTFKNNLLESKIDTIGGQYPVFFRNGNVNYKEFSISGLISMIADQNNEFSLGEINYHSLPDEIFKQDHRMTTKDNNTNEKSVFHSNTELSSYNYQREREFKLEVLKWLTNGKEKVLKTPSEGNYIVRLMNTSLSPNDTFGRMLHTFTSTAYEVASYNFSSLRKFDFLGGSQKLKRTERSQALNQESLDENNRIIMNSSSYFKIDVATVYSEPNLLITANLKNGSKIQVQTNIYGIAVLTSGIMNEGLRSLELPNTVKSDGKIGDQVNWPANSKIEYSYVNYTTNIGNWFYIDKVETVTNENKFNGKEWIQGQGTLIHLKNYLNNSSKVESGGKLKSQIIVSTFPYVLVEKIGPITDKKINQGYYVINIPELQSLENLGLTTNQTQFIYRNLNDFSLGRGLQVKIICPHKKLTFNQNIDDDRIYAI